MISPVDREKSESSTTGQGRRDGIRSTGKKHAGVD
jgi:hypothetical protein